MLNFIFYFMSVLAFSIGLVLFLFGRAKKNDRLKGVGIGFIVCIMLIEAPNFIDGFIKGFTNGFNS